MSTELQKEFDSNFKEMFMEILKRREEQERTCIGNFCFFKSNYPDSKKAFLDGFLNGELIMNEDDIEVEQEDIDMNCDGVPFINFNIKVKPFDMCVPLVAFCESQWCFYLNESRLFIQRKLASGEKSSELRCPSCNSNLKECGVYSSKPNMFLYNEYTNEFDALVEVDDFQVHCCHCGEIVDDSKMSFKFKRIIEDKIV